MTDNDRMTWGFILEIVDVLERHGYHHSDNQRTGQAIGLLGDLDHIYEGSRDTHRSAHIAVAPSPPSAAQPPIRTGPDPVVLTSADVSTIFAALDIAADYKPGRAAACADCADQTCLTCQSRLRDAQAHDRLADQILHGTEASAAAQRPDPDRAVPASGQLQPPADREAGQ
jgi:hypothetical protein